MDIRDLGLVSYAEALREQESILKQVIEGTREDTLILVEHPPVITFGRISEEKNIKDEDFFRNEKAEIIHTGRGGKITYHSPGQLVLYPIIDLSEKKKDISCYIDFLEKTVTNSLVEIGVPAERLDQRRGVWLKGKKIAFIGIALKKWVTYHGVAVNINNSTIPFSRFNVCGESDIQAFSAYEYLGRKLNMDKVKDVFAERFCRDMEIEYDIIKV